MRPLDNLGRNVTMEELAAAILNHQEFNAAASGAFTWNGDPVPDADRIVFLTYLAGDGTLLNASGTFSWAFSGTYDWTHYPIRFDGGFQITGATDAYAWSCWLRQKQYH